MVGTRPAEPVGVWGFSGAWSPARDLSELVFGAFSGFPLTFDGRDGMFPSTLDGKHRFMQRNDLLQGTLDMLILKVLNAGPMHGFGIAQRIQLLSEEVLSVGE